MGLYGRYVLPRLCDLAMRNRVARAERAAWVPEAAGLVVEVGIGSGLNLAFYGAAVSRVCGIDPSATLLRMAARRAAAVRLPVALCQASGEALPFADAVADTVVSTWTLCSIPDPRRALGEMRRVLKPGGRLIFVEHGQAPDPGVGAWQVRLTPVWRRLAGGCHLDRPVDRLLVEAGFAPDRLARGYAPGPRLMAYLYRGIARPGPPAPAGKPAPPCP